MLSKIFKAVFASESSSYDPDEARQHNRLGDEYYCKNMKKEAIEEYLITIELDKRNMFSELDMNIFARLADCYANINKFDEAMSYANYCIEKYKKSPIGYACKGYIYYLSGRAIEAIQWYATAYNIDNYYSNTIWGLGMSYCVVGEVDLAYQQYLRLRPLDVRSAEQLLNAINERRSQRVNGEECRNNKSSTNESYYEILGISSSATTDEIKRAYKDMVKVWHPDRFQSEVRLRQMADNKLKQINEAYTVIMNG